MFRFYLFFLSSDRGPGKSCKIACVYSIIFVVVLLFVLAVSFWLSNLWERSSWSDKKKGKKQQQRQKSFFSVYCVCVCHRHPALCECAYIYVCVREWRSTVSSIFCCKGAVFRSIVRIAIWIIVDTLKFARKIFIAIFVSIIMRWIRCDLQIDCAIHFVLYWLGEECIQELASPHEREALFSGK